MAVAIDGEILQDAYLAQLKPDSEIVLSRKSAVVKGRSSRAAHYFGIPAWLRLVP
jgi:hypothetical protein